MLVTSPHRSLRFDVVELTFWLWFLLASPLHDRSFVLVLGSEQSGADSVTSDRDFKCASLSLGLLLVGFVRF